MNKHHSRREGAAKRAILVVSFGTSYMDTLQKTIAAIEADIQEAYPDWEVRRAFTSGMVINKLKDRDNIYISNVNDAVRRLAEEGFSALVVQPTHVIRGLEYEKMLRDISPYADRFDTIAYGDPLLGAPESLRRTAMALIEEFGAPQPDSAIVLMGHGTPHPANAAYTDLETLLHAMGQPHILIGTVESFPGLKEVLAGAKSAGVSRATLAPLMIVAGDHALNDMAGEEEDSWKNAFAAAGFQVDIRLRGLGECPAIRAILTHHTGQAINRTIQ
jgi:sirohydrochlorin cobaltochelatase